jgi:hypothetical protein
LPSANVVNPTRSAKRIETTRRSATEAWPRAATGDIAPALAGSGWAHSPQNFSPGSFRAPQDGQGSASGAAHSEQNFRPVRFSVPQFEQTTCVSSGT